MKLLHTASVAVRLALAACLLITCGWLVPGAVDRVTLLAGILSGVYAFVLIVKTGHDLRKATK